MSMNNSNHYVFVDIPSIIFPELEKCRLAAVDSDEYFKYLEWVYYLWSDFKGPMVRYRVNNMLVADVYGYLYNYYLTTQDINRAVATIH